ncbi:MAG: peptidyl-prolyl cis-trans isomerase [Acidobacteria bacterium]|nr:MAG: peptidyl-prolyl cis-trans isomerase [Acidobacteriota bacterium]REK07416.1 MAG: peptidyl-prolyl cis-trans isomerase [Acidobacteriota bacterium]
MRHHSIPFLASHAASTPHAKAPTRAGARSRRGVAALAVALAAAATLWASGATGQEGTESASGQPAAAASPPQVTIETSMGAILIELDPVNAPLSTANFLEYVRAGFYDGTVFHRVIDGFMIQGGGFTEDLMKKPTRDPVRNESGNGLSNARGTIAMARTNDPHSATAQFYINQVDNPALDKANAGEWGYTVFGRVLEGMDVVDAIAKVATGPRPNGMNNVPREPVTIVSATVAQ